MMKKLYILTTCLIGIFCLSNELFAKEVLNSIAGYTFGETVHGNQTRISFRLRKPFLEFSRGIVHVNPKTRKIEAIELKTSLGAALAKIPIKRAYRPLGTHTPKKDWDEEKKEKSNREELAVNRIFTLALDALDKRYHLGETPSYDTEIIHKKRIHVTEEYTEERSDEYKIEHSDDGFSRVVYRKKRPDVSVARIIPALKLEPAYTSKREESVFGSTEGINFRITGGRSAFGTESSETPYGVDTWTGKAIYAYNAPISDAENSFEIRRLYFCIDKQTLRIVIVDCTSQQENSTSTTREDTSKGAADVL